MLMIMVMVLMVVMVMLVGMMCIVGPFGENSIFQLKLELGAQMLSVTFMHDKQPLVPLGVELVLPYRTLKLDVLGIASEKLQLGRSKMVRLSVALKSGRIVRSSCLDLNFT